MTIHHRRPDEGEVRSHRFRLIFAFIAAAVLAVSAQQPAPAPQFAPIEAYIKQTWQVLTRSNRGLASAAADPKFHAGADGR
jgi:hypothetical protein